MELTDEQRKARRIVCAAIRHKETGELTCGPRHHDCLSLAKVPYRDESDFEQGFVDQFCKFLTRAEAWMVAKRQGQLVKKYNWGEELYSEHLY